VLQYVIAGLATGGIYAIAASGLVITYVSSGILNFAFASMAFFIARFYYFLHVQHNWGIVPAAALALFVAGPALGIALYYAVFRFLRLSSALVKVVVTLGLSVTIPALATIIFGNGAILKAPGLAPEPVRVFDFLGVPVTLDTVIIYIAVVGSVVLGAGVLRYTEVGLKVRAMVDSPAMTSLSGSSVGAISVGVWAVGSFLAGLTGVLVAPNIGLDPANFTLLLASAFAAVVAAKLRSLPVAVIVGVLMGVVTSLIQWKLPPSSPWTGELIEAIPFIFIAIFLIYNLIRTGRVSETEGVGGALDRAILPQGESQLAGSTSVATLQTGSLGLIGKYAGPAFLIVVAFILPVLPLPSYYTPLIEAGVAYGIIFLSFTLVTGEGGMIWLCQITFAGVGAVTAAQLATNHGWPILAAIVAGGLVALPMGVIIGFFTIRLGDLYVALVTLTFGLLMDNLFFTQGIFQNSGLGVNMAPPKFVSGNIAFTYFLLIVFCVVALLVVNLRRSTTGLALNAVRWSEPGSRTLGISVLQMKTIVAGLAAMVAGIGGGFLATAQTSAQPMNFETFVGVAWLAVLVTAGVRSCSAALFAGLTFSILPGLTLNWPTWTAQVPPLLFGLGAIGIAKFPDGTLAEQGRQFRRLLFKLSRQAPPPVLEGVPQDERELVLGEEPPAHIASEVSS